MWLVADEDCKSATYSFDEVSEDAVEVAADDEDDEPDDEPDVDEVVTTWVVAPLVVVFIGGVTDDGVVALFMLLLFVEADVELEVVVVVVVFAGVDGEYISKILI